MTPTPRSGGQGVAGSNPAAPTRSYRSERFRTPVRGLFLIFREPLREPPALSGSRRLPEDLVPSHRALGQSGRISCRYTGGAATGVRAAGRRASCRPPSPMPTVPLVIRCWICGGSGLAGVLAHRQHTNRSLCRWLSSRPGPHPRSPDRFRRWPLRLLAWWPCPRRR